MEGQVVKVKRDVLEACMKCPLCNKLMKEATTVSLCLHTFCRKCIYKKLSDEGFDCCPVCDIELGCLPLDKLRPDHNLQDIRFKIFPYKRRKIEAPDLIMPSISPPPAKRKERSLSSLVVGAPKASPKMSVLTGLTGRRSKVNARKAFALRGCKEPEKDCSAAQKSMSSRLPYNSLSKNFQNNKQDSSLVEPHDELPNKDSNNDKVMLEGKADLSTPLNFLVEAVNRTKLIKSTKAEPSIFPDSKLGVPEIKANKLPSVQENELYTTISKKKKKNGQNKKAQDKKNCMSYHGGPIGKKLQAVARQMGGVFDNGFGAKFNRRNSPVWFSLVPSEDERGDALLPQISARYLRINDGKMPVSFIQKYLVKKLDLTSQAEIEIMCRGQPVIPTLPMNKLVDLWFRTASTSKKLPVSLGSSAKDLVMVLSYCLKTPQA